jgi:RNA-directed DNA polymerase
MERKPFKDTTLGTPQGGVISPLLANVYLHELDKYMEKYTALSHMEKRARRRQGLANFTYVRYADDWVILSNGTREHTEAMRDEIRTFLSSTLRLSLSPEKTKITHINDGFDFLGFRIRRCMRQTGMTTKVLIPAKALERHLSTIRAVTSPSTHKGSLVTKILALNRIITGWCRYYQYASNTSSPFQDMEYQTFWLTAHWIAGKHRQSIPETLKQYRMVIPPGSVLTVLTKHTQYRSKRYMKHFIKPNPYTTQQEGLEREEFLNENPWLGQESKDRLGMADRRKIVIERDGFECQMCHVRVTYASAKVDHKRTVASYKKAEDAHRLENLWTLCDRCHRRKTENDRQTESRMR